jgi:MFS family permease
VFFAGLLGVGVVQLLEPFTRHVLDVGAATYGVLLGAYGIGAVTASATMVAFADSFRPSRLTLCGLVAMASGAALLGAAPVWGVALVALVVMGFGQILCTVSCNATLQLNVDEQFRGRVSSQFLMSFFGAAPLGALIGGLVGEAIGLRPTMIAAGAILAAFTTWSAVHWHRLRPLDDAPPLLDEHRSPAVDPSAP